MLATLTLFQVAAVTPITLPASSNAGNVVRATSILNRRRGKTVKTRKDQCYSASASLTFDWCLWYPILLKTITFNFTFKTKYLFSGGLPTDPVCSQPVEVGPCRALRPAFFYNTQTKRCERFVYGGCKGTGINAIAIRIFANFENTWNFNV